ncbi:mannobiose 2-epimerase [Paenibacillus phyllosphaerae]|uniref:Cellobiose 2-epimerase n=1 Tax=Paenibacillus phyllosphaerae TaxID=274593 RepID=A0A7W5B257_9BACL|nr:AGE family epimerase/isomerase [Paenibacillus phyllosphaerae]MBB3112958.1 mannobiose 2-epimerase [Paenibacillus phyllosphaerae]
MTTTELARTNNWLPRIEQELKDNILAFWINHTIDEQRGGFIGELSTDQIVNPSADKSLVLNARILWTFASAFRLFPDERYLKMAERAYAYLKAHFFDTQHGGLYWSVTAEGAPSETKKQVYGQAFAIYAFAEYNRATGHQEALNEAIELFRLLEQHSYDPAYGGYVEALARDWQETDDLSLSGKDLNEKKSMNTHLHVMEGYTNLYRVWQDEALHAKLKGIIELTLAHIIDDRSAHFHLFFDEQWNVKSDHVSYGHDIEGSWLIVEAAEVLGDEELLARAKAIAIRMADVTLNEGVDEDGGLWNEADSSGIIDSHKDWWPQAEAVVGFFNAYQLTGEERYLDAARQSWSFIEEHLVDKTHGEWYWSVTHDRVPNLAGPKVSAWKCPYHNSRACFEMIERLQHG